MSNTEFVMNYFPYGAEVAVFRFMTYWFVVAHLISNAQYSRIINIRQKKSVLLPIFPFTE